MLFLGTDGAISALLMVPLTRIVFITKSRSTLVITNRPWPCVCVCVCVCYLDNYCAAYNVPVFILL